MKYLLLLFLSLSTVLTSTASEETKAAAGVIYVNAASRPGGSGRAWSSAYKYLQDALTEASGMTGNIEIRVAQGTYYPDDDDGGNYTDGDRNASFYMLNNVTINGGYFAGSITSSSRNWTLYPTILSGDINQNGTDKSYQIIKNDQTKSTQLTNSAVLSGFIIEESDGVPQHGGGMFNNFSSPLVTECIFRNNNAYQGGAIKNEDSSPVFKNCLFYSNSSGFGGNAIRHDGGILSLLNCTIVDNSSTSASGDEGILSNNGSIIIKNSILWNNGIELEAVSTTSPSYQVSYSIVDGGYSGTGNLDADPLFVDEGNNDYHIGICTPAYNAGTNSVSQSNLDLGSGGRELFDTLDIGAYEYLTGRFYVDSSATGLNNGSSWSDAFVYMIDAMDSLEACGTPADVWVAKGTYHPYELGYSQGAFRPAHFKMLNNVRLYGGFAGGEVSLGQRDWELNRTILSGDTQDNDHSGSISDNNTNVIFNEYSAAYPLTNSSIIDGFTVSGGWALPAASGRLNGGGMCNIYASPIIKNCRFQHNSAQIGGGIFNENESSPLISNCEFNDNLATRRGGGLFNSLSAVSITNTSFTNNVSSTTNANDPDKQGGGLALSGSTGTITNCHFSGNEADIKGGAVELSSSSAINFIDCSFENNEAENGGAVFIATGAPINPGEGLTTFFNCDFDDNISQFHYAITEAFHFGGAINVLYGTVSIDSCRFEGNLTENYGGAIYFFKGVSTVNNSTFINNSAIYLDGDPQAITPVGGAIYIDEQADVTLTRNLFRDNQSRDGGGAIFVNNADPEILNCLFVDNKAYLDHGGAISNDNYATTKIRNCTFANVSRDGVSTIAGANNSQVEIYNSIVWTAATFGEIYDLSASQTTVFQSIVKGGFIFGVDLIDEDPLYNAPGSYDFTLKRCSPGIDKGVNANNSTSIDFEGNSRVYNAKFLDQSTIDFGAFELQENYVVDCVCENDLTILAGFEHGSYEAGETIIASGTVPSGGGVLLSAENFIELVPPFEADSQTTFRTAIKPTCMN